MALNPITANTDGGAVTGSQDYDGFMELSVVNHAGAGGNVVITLTSGNTVRVFPGEAWGLPYIGKPYGSITVNGASGDCDVTVVY